MTIGISGLDPTAHLRIVPVTGDLPSDRATPLLAVLRELLAQWQDKSAITTGAVELLENGAFVAIAYQPFREDVSGCTKDQLTHALLDFEQRMGISMLNGPNLAVEIDGRVRLMDREEFRRLRAEGVIADSTVAFDHLVDRVGDLPRFRTTVGESWYNRIGRPKTASA